MGPLGKAATSALVTVGLLVGVEGVLALADVPDPGLFAGDPASHWSLRPGLDRVVPFAQEGRSFRVQTSADGYRDDPLPDGGLWVAAMGCSTTFGWGVEAAQAWPALLEQALGVPVLNGGVPGYSTHQALRSVGPVLAAEPALVIYAYLVRDAQLAPRPDDQAVPTPWLGRRHLVRLLSGLLRGGPATADAPHPGPRSTGAAAGVPRVSPRDYASNLRQLVERARTLGSDALVVAFPMQESPLDHVLALEQVDAPRETPRLPSSAFFVSDPLHLTADGHRLLAQALEAPVRARLSGAEAPGAPSPGP